MHAMLAVHNTGKRPFHSRNHRLARKVRQDVIARALREAWIALAQADARPDSGNRRVLIGELEREP